MPVCTDVETVPQGKGQTAKEVLSRIDFGGCITLFLMVSLISLCVPHARLTPFIQIGSSLTWLSAKFNEDLPVRPMSILPPFLFLKFTIVETLPCYRSINPLCHLPHSFPRHRVHDRTRTCPPAVSLVPKGASPGWIEQLFRVGVQFLGHVFHPIVVPDGPFEQRVYCGYASSLSCGDICLNVVVSFA